MNSSNENTKPSKRKSKTLSSSENLIPDLTTHLRTVESLVPYAKNARQHSDAQIAQIAGSIKAFKFRSPIVVTSDGGIVCGHGRVLAARKLGMKEVPCVYADDLSENERRAYILADNKIAENATWDQEMLNIELDDLFALGFDLQIAGFTQEDIKTSVDEFVPKLPDDDATGAEQKFILVVTLQNAEEQNDLFAELNDGGYKVKVG